MDADDLLRRLIELLLEADGIIGSLLDAATQLQDEGTFAPLPKSASRRRRQSAIRRSPAAAAAQKPPPAPRDEAADAMCRDGVAQIEFDRRRRRVRVVIPGLAPMWMSRQRAALLQALAEPAADPNVSTGEFVPFKAIEQLRRRIEELIHTTLKPHSIVSSIFRLREKSLPHHDLIQTRDSHTSGETTAYRFVMRANGRVIEHLPDGGAIDPATGSDG